MLIHKFNSNPHLMFLLFFELFLNLFKLFPYHPFIFSSLIQILIFVKVFLGLVFNFQFPTLQIFLIHHLIFLNLNLNLLNSILLIKVLTKPSMFLNLIISSQLLNHLNILNLSLIEINTLSAIEIN